MVRFINQTQLIKPELQKDLHSNMVRFIILRVYVFYSVKFEFTFQYG